MNWNDLPAKCRVYLILIYGLSIPVAALVLGRGGEYGPIWALFTLASFFVATISLHLPQLPSVIISMGDVFTILALIHFGPGPALLTYWANVVATALAGHIKRRGWQLLKSISYHRLLFNVACCALCLYVMSLAYTWATSLPVRTNSLIGLALLAITWFLVNTTTLSLAISFSTGQSAVTVWKEGLGLCLLNFFGSAAAAGLISLFYDRAGFSVFLLSLPLAVILYWLYTFYIQKYQQAQSHIAGLNALYLQTIEAMANAVDAKDGYTHGHIRRVEAYATELAKCLGIRSDEELMAIKAGALLHDIGKIAIPEYILNKPTVLTETEYEKMKIHPVVGANILKDIAFPYPVMPMVKSHHERWDGKGYPDGLKEDQIPMTARILALVDCYDALTSNRPYRSPMPRNQVVELFRKESGKAYDPAVVDAFLTNIERIELAGKAVVASDANLWGVKNVELSKTQNVRNFERVQPTVSYGKALNADANIQRELLSIFEFVRAEIHALSESDVLSFIGSKLGNVISFDAAVFFRANLGDGTVVAVHTLGNADDGLLGLTLPLEQKLSGWVAANNQPLFNLPPFPDFLRCQEPKPSFQLSAIAPMNKQGAIFGAVSLYRKEQVKFSDEEFRRLEIIAAQTAIALSRVTNADDGEPLLFDSLTGIPNGFQLYLMFDQIGTDANRYEYPVALISIHLEELPAVRRRWGHLSGDELIRGVAKYLRTQLRDTDLLVRYAANEFIALCPRMSRDQAEALKSRLQNDLDHFDFMIRSDEKTAARASIGIGIFSEDGAALESLLSTAEWKANEDSQLRNAVKNRIHSLPSGRGL
jgi:diguanylate cyclase (GGDEF)-like protein/putative nucleotidyltransferase with HDIG domain